MNTYNVVVIGSGPGGYVAAIKCAQLGMKTAIVEKYSSLGGTCLNVGCIPSKALLDSSHLFDQIKRDSALHGIKLDTEVELDFKAMVERKQKVVSQTCDGIDYLMKKNNIDVYTGIGYFKNEKQIEINTGTTKTVLNATHFVIATGSKPTKLPSITIDKKKIITSTEALSLKEVPKRMLVIGGGVIGLELGQVYNRLGTEVSVIEYTDRIIPNMDYSLGKDLMKVLKKKGIKFFLNHKVEVVEKKQKHCIVKASTTSGDAISFETDIVLVAVGRTPNTEHLGLENTAIIKNAKHQIEVNNRLQTACPHIYAIGDVIRGAMLAHKAEDEGIFVAEQIAGQKPHINYNLIPNVVYTWPEVASVGKTEEALKSENLDYRSGVFHMRALGRSRASGDLDGFVKILSDKNSDEILGVHIIGARAADLIGAVTTAMEYKASAEDISRICHAHPTYSEAIKEAAFLASGQKAIHN